MTFAYAHADTREEDFFEGIDTSFGGLIYLAPHAPASVIAGVKQCSDTITQAIAAPLPTMPGYLAEASGQLSALITATESADFDAFEKASLLHELRVKRTQLNDALALALDLTLDATTHGTNIVVNSLPVVSTTLGTTVISPLTVQREWLESSTGGTRESDSGRTNEPEISADRAFTRTLRTAPTTSPVPSGTALASLSATVTRPYFFRDFIEAPVYQLRDPGLRNAAATPPALTAWATVLYKGVPVTIGRIVHDGPQPISFVPPVSVSLQAHARVMLLSGEPGIDVIASATTPSGAKAPSVELAVPHGWKVKHSASLPMGQTSFLVLPPDVPFTNGRPAGVVTATATFADRSSYTEGYRPVGYPGLISTNFFAPATEHIAGIELRLPQTLPEVGYLPGTGDDVPQYLQWAGLNPIAILTVDDLTPAKLAKFQTIILGVRTYAAHPDLHGAPTRALLDYARAGGNVVVQYQTFEFTADDAPYPLTLGNAEKVVDETAPVHLLNSQLKTENSQLNSSSYALLTSPNLITSTDFNGWVEERGHGFLRTWDTHYTALTETHDPGEPAEGIAPQEPQRGGLITTPMGTDPKHLGRWTYCAFALYRQIPEAVPGAFRLFMNLLQP